MMNSPSRKHNGRLPSQHPPDWKNITGPTSATTRAIAPSAAAVAWTRRGTGDRFTKLLGLKEAERLRAVAHQQVLGLGVVLEHHLVVLTSHARDLVATKGGAGWVQVVAIRPH